MKNKDDFNVFSCKGSVINWIEAMVKAKICLQIFLSSTVFLLFLPQRTGKLLNIFTLLERKRTV